MKRRVEPKVQGKPRWSNRDEVLRFVSYELDRVEYEQVMEDAVRMSDLPDIVLKVSPKSIADDPAWRERATAEYIALLHALLSPVSPVKRKRGRQRRITVDERYVKNPLVQMSDVAKSARKIMKWYWPSETSAVKEKGPGETWNRAATLAFQRAGIKRPKSTDISTLINDYCLRRGKRVRKKGESPR